jgi:SPP1 gp7 family putative phage head morphogenesis protein
MVTTRKRRKVVLPKQRVLMAVRPNAGLEVWYRKQLDAKIQEMQESLVFWITARYRSTGLASDATPAQELQKELAKLTTRWSKIFKHLASSLGERFTQKVTETGDAVLNSTLRAQGMIIPFTMSGPMRDAYEAVIGENVGLIKSIAQQHLTDVEQIVMRSVARGRDLHTLTNDLRTRYNLTRQRAALIARDQNNKATSTLQSARQQQLGIVEGVWKHSHAGKVPRPSHVKADGQRFELAKGMYLDGKWVMPGEDINCRCTWQPVIPGLD